MPVFPQLAPPLPREGLPDPPRYDLWPPAVRSAWRLSGALVRCGPGLRGIGWPETPRVRLAAIADWLGHDRIASHLTAAWVWGAVREPRDPLQVSMLAGRRRPLASRADLRVYELRYGAEDVERFGPFQVTRPMRTALDLLHDPEVFGRREAVACRLLLLADGGTAAMARHLAEHRRPHRRLAQARFREFVS